MASWYPARAIVAIRDGFNAAFPGRDKSTDGIIGDAAHNARKSDHNADWDSVPPGMVRAIDVDKDLLGPFTPQGAMQAVVDRMILDPRIAYVIYRRRIWQNPAVYRNGGWRPYTPTGKSGWYNPHEEHAHFSIRHGAPFENDPSPFPIATPETTIQEDIEMIIYRAARAGAHGCLAANGQYALLRSAEERTNLLRAGAREVWIEQVTLDALIAESRGQYDTVDVRNWPAAGTTQDVE